MVGEDVLVAGAVTDSRQAPPGSLFFALAGATSDGHRFAGDALRRGAAAVVVVPSRFHGHPRIEVDAPIDALAALATDERDAYRGTVIGVTGSTGKTTTKDFLASILAQRAPTHASPGSFNNQIGVPLTVLATPQGSRYLVCEIGAGEIGEIRRYCRIARPEIGIVTNVGLAHLETFGDVDAIARGKRELVEALPPGGIAVLNLDDDRVAAFGAHTRARTVTYGRSTGADVTAERLAPAPHGAARFLLGADGRRATVELPVPGEHMVMDALAAAAAGLALGVSVDACARGLRSAQTSPWRMQLSVTPGGLRVLNDAYNSSPPSAAAALTTARLIARGGRLVAVIGEMAQLGSRGASEHRTLGALAARIRTERLVTIGPEAAAVARSAIELGLPASRVSCHDDRSGALEYLRETCRPGDLVLLKASRSAGLERIAEALP